MKILKAYLCKFFPSLVDSEEQLSGTWKSSLELTKENNDFASFPSKKSEFLNQVLGDLEVTYNNETSYLKSPDKKVTIGGKSFDWKGSPGDTALPYKVIRKNHNEIYLVAKNPYGTGWLLNKLVFLSENIYKVKTLGITECFVRQ